MGSGAVDAPASQHMPAAATGGAGASRTASAAHGDPRRVGNVSTSRRQCARSPALAPLPCRMARTLLHHPGAAAPMAARLANRTISSTSQSLMSTRCITLVTLVAQESKLLAVQARCNICSKCCMSMMMQRSSSSCSTVSTIAPTESSIRPARTRDIKRAERGGPTRPSGGGASRAASAHARQSVLLQLRCKVCVWGVGRPPPTGIV